MANTEMTASLNLEPTPILVVDDEPQILSLLARLLSRRFAKVIQASSGLEGVRLFEQHRPGVVISDIRMPEMGGFDLLKTVRQVDPDVEVILITGFGEMVDAVEAIRHGASDFIPKPFDLTLVNHAVDRCLERRRFKVMAQDYTRKLEEEVRERTEELVRANRELEKLGKTREDFLALISHELRTPLAGMGLAELALEEIDSLSREEIQEFLGGILESFRRLHTFSERALLYSRLMSGAAVCFRPGVDFAALISEEVSGIASCAADAGVALRWDPPAGAITINGDPDLLRFLVHSLLDNAVKHNRRGGAACVSLQAVDGGITFSVADTGIGLPPEAIESLFEPFAAPDVLHHRSGSALSLAISRLVAERHGMHLACASDGPGQGTIFTLSYSPPGETDVLRQ